MSHDFSCPTPLILTIFWPSSEESEQPKDLHRFGQVALDSSPLNRRCRPLSYNDRCNVWWRVWFVGCAVPKDLEMWKQYSDFFSMDCYTALQGKCPWLSRNTQIYTANSDEFDDQAEIPSISTSLRSLGVCLLLRRIQSNCQSKSTRWRAPAWSVGRWPQRSELGFQKDGYIFITPINSLLPIPIDVGWSNLYLKQPRLENDPSFLWISWTKFGGTPSQTPEWISATCLTHQGAKIVVVGLLLGFGRKTTRRMARERRGASYSGVTKNKM